MERETLVKTHDVRIQPRIENCISIRTLDVCIALSQVLLCIKATTGPQNVEMLLLRRW